MSWFDVDRTGLAKLLERRSKAFVLFELWSNSADTSATRIDITLREIPGRAACVLTVVDDDPNGFADLTHAFTLFAESTRKGDAGKRGRFNLGEKIALALCEEAEISTTTGTVFFDKDGNRRATRAKRFTGSEFRATIRMTRQEMAEVEFCISTLIPTVPTYFNGTLIEPHRLVAEFTATLPTIGAREDGTLFNTARQTTVRVYETKDNEPASVYELGVPVVATGDKYHVDVCQKVPVNMDRDNVPPAFLSAVRVATLNATADKLSAGEATAAWVQDATGDERCNAAVVESVLTMRFGKDRVAYDPSDPEANALAVTKGYTVIHGGTLSAGQWANARASGAVLPAGQVTPSPKPYSTDPNAKPVKVLEQDDWSEDMRWVATLARMMAREMMGVRLSVRMVDTANGFIACYGCATLDFNVRRLGRGWFSGSIASIIDLIIHEFGHQYEANHLSEKYYDALTMLAGKAVSLAITRPELFSRVLEVA